jgi:DNA-directed RNA polymerase subunit RPC12/RpoP
MIKFSCNKCGHKIGVKDEMAGKRGKCPECSSIIVVPEKTLFVRFQCQNCGRNISALPTQSGKKGKCPNCNQTLIVPQLHGLTLLDAPAEYKLQDRQPKPPAPAQQEIQNEENETRPQDQVESDKQRKLPWFIDIFLYPTSAPGLAHLAIFVGVPFLIYLVRQLLGPFALMLWLPSLIVNFLIGLYMCWYFAECVRDSANGGVRAPEAFASADIGSMFGQWLYIAACYALFIAPATFYSIFTGRIDAIFWILAAYGVFFFPMGLLAVVMFDSSSAFNPLLWIGSILSTFFQYCGLVLLIAGISLAFRAMIGIGESHAPQQDTIGTGIMGAALLCPMLYLVFVVAHLFGRFYWRYQDKLNWEV